MLKVLEKPLPKPTDESYVIARVLESIVESKLALEFLERGITRNAAGKAFQSWKALMTALMRLERDRLVNAAKDEDERKWILDRAIPRVPTNRMKRISQMLYDVGYREVPPWTDHALNLHEYQHNGPDPDQALSKYNSPEEAAHDILTLVEEVIKVVEGLRDGGKVKWDDELDSALKDVKNTLNKLMREYLRRPG